MANSLKDRLSLSSPRRHSLVEWVFWRDLFWSGALLGVVSRKGQQSLRFLIAKSMDAGGSSSVQSVYISIGTYFIPKKCFNTFPRHLIVDSDKNSFSI